MFDALDRWRNCLTGVLLLSFVLIPINVTAVEVFKATTLSNSLVERERSQGFHQHNTNSALLVFTHQGRFGIHRYDFTSGQFETLRVIDRAPVLEFIREAPIEFQTVNTITFIVIQGRLYSTDGTPAGTQFIDDFGVFPTAGLGGADNNNILTLHAAGNQLLFVANTTSSRFRRQLVISDGSTNGTRVVDGDFESIGTIFNLESDTYFFGQRNADDNVQIWRVLRDGSGVSLVVSTSSSFNRVPALRALSSINSNIVTQRNLAYFCLDDKLAIFSGTRLTLERSIPCRGRILQNASDIFLMSDDAFFSLDTNTLTLRSLFDLNQGESLSGLNSCLSSSSVALVLRNDNGLAITSRLVVYSRQFGFREIASLSSDVLDISACLNDGIVANGFVYDFTDGIVSRRIRAGGGMELAFSSTLFNPDRSLQFDDKIYAFSSSSRDPFVLETIKFLEFSIVEIDLGALGAWLGLLLADDAN